MSEMREAGLTSKSWPFEEARRVLKRYQNAPPAKGHVLFETGYGPSGLPHIGTFGEVARTSMVMRAFREISDCLLYTSPSPRDRSLSRMPSSA